MPHPPQDDHAIASDEQLQLLDLLYGELDGADAERAERAIDASDELAGELEGLRSVRSLFAELTDEDPPQAVSAKLLQAAAAHAPKTPARSTEREGFWVWLAGLFRPIVAYPGIAAVASLVLVAGVAGTLYLSGKGRTTEPAREASTATDTRKDGDKAARSAGETQKAEKTGSPERYADIDDEDLDPAQPSEAEQPVAETKSPAKLDAKLDAKKKPATSEGGKRDTSESRGGDGVTATSDSTIFPGGESDGDADDAPPAPDDEPSADPAPPSVDVDVPAPDLKSLPNDEQESEARELHDRAKTAAKRGDCAATNSLAERIRSLDVGYYNDVYLRDATVRKCAATQGSQNTNK